jgi:hypothetical protein
MNSETAPIDEKPAEKRRRGLGRGSNFFALSKAVLEQLWVAETTNRLNFVLTYLVLLAGTGSDHRLTKWSANACENHLGIGKPRAKHAIEELIACGLIKLAPSSARFTPQYELPELPLEEEPIFLPVQIVTGLSGETPILRRVRETGDPLVLRMLIDLYGLVSLDATYGIPLNCLRAGGTQDSEVGSRKLASVGVHAVWGLKAGSWRAGGGDWTVPHYIEGKKGGQGSWDKFWERVDLLKQIGAIFYEPWLFDSKATDAEPIMPLDPAGYYAVANPEGEAILTGAAFDVSRALVGDERSYVFDNADADFFIALPLHQQEPTLRHVARLRVEADTPGRRLAWKRRRELLERWTSIYRQLLTDASEGRFDRPMRVAGQGGVQ